MAKTEYITIKRAELETLIKFVASNMPLDKLADLNQLLKKINEEREEDE